MLWYLRKPTASLPTAFKIKSWILTKGKKTGVSEKKRKGLRMEWSTSKIIKKLYRLRNRTRTSKHYVLTAPTKSHGVTLSEEE